MKQKTIIQSLFLLVALLVGSVGSVWGESVIMSYSGSTTNMTGNNDAATVGLNASEWSVIGAKGGQNNYPGLNKDGTIRLYASSGNGASFTVTSLTGAIISSISLDVSSGVATVKVGDNTITGSNNTYNINNSSFVIVNTQNSGQTQIRSITINYKYNLTSFAFTNPTANVTLLENGGNYEAEYTQTVSFAPNTYTGAITYSIDEEASTIGANTMADVDEDGVVTVFASANEASTIVVKASGAATALHNAPADATYTLNVNAILAHTITVVANNDSYGSVEVSGPTIIATPNADYKVASGTDGYTVISGTATVVNNGDNTFTVTPSSDCTIQVNFEQKPAPTFSFASATTDVNYGSDITEPLLSNNSSGTVTYSSSNTKVATVDENTGEVTAVAVGTTAITASITADATYCSASTSYTLTVNEYAATPALPSTETLFSETFSGCDGTGGNDNEWSGSIASKTYETSMADNSGWTMSNEYAAKECVRLGTGSKLGKAKTPALALESALTYTLTFRAGAWDGKSTNLKISMDNGTISADHVTMKNSAFDSFELTITNASSDAKITFEGNATSNSQFFLDDVKITAPTTPGVSVTVPASGWGTFCSPYALDLGNAATTVEAYAVSKYNAAAGTVTFEKITGKVPAKTPLVIKGEASSTKKIAVTEDATSAPAANILRGYLSPTYYAGADATETLMGMSGGEFKKVQAGTIPANRAVLVMATDDFNNIPDGSKLTFIIEDNSETDGINNHSINYVKYDGNAYNLSGQRVGNDYKGIVIVNGKKLIRK